MTLLTGFFNLVASLCSVSSQSKTVCMHFSQLRSANADPDLRLYGVNIPVVNEFKFLGLIFDKNLTCKQHIRYSKDRCFKAAEPVASNRSQGLGSRLCNFAKVVSLPCSSEIRLWLCRVWFSSKVCPRVTGPSGECSVAYLPRSIQNVTSVKPSCGGGRVSTRAVTSATESTIHLQTPVKPRQPYFQLCVWYCP